MGRSRFLPPAAGLISVDVMAVIFSHQSWLRSCGNASQAAGTPVVPRLHLKRRRDSVTLCWRIAHELGRARADRGRKIFRLCRWSIRRHEGIWGTIEREHMYIHDDRRQPTAGSGTKVVKKIVSHPFICTHDTRRISRVLYVEPKAITGA